MDSIKVAIKVRPLIKREQEENLPVQWTVQDNSITPIDPELKKRGEPFYFDHIFDASQTNADVFDVIAKPIVDAAINGINGTIFAYGQTSSGKTYTMMGGDDNPGVIPLSIDYTFDKITSTYDREFLLRVSYIEIYNEKINDLLDKNGIDLKIKEEKSGQAVVLCKEEVANCPEVVIAIMRKGLKNRRIGETNMNERSSRSHTIFRITIESREPNSDGAVQVSQLNLVDLAGSERPKQSGATGDRFNEGRHINMSLSALGLVIMQLSESQDNPSRFVNFRDSKLTRILQTSLGGNAMTTIICAVTPAAVDETQCTLAFASRAKRIKNKPTVNECVSDAALLKRYAKQLAKLKNELEKARGANLVEMESKLMEKESKLIEKDRAYQLLEERIELLKTRIVSGNTMIEDGRSRRRTQRRRTWGGPGTFQTKLLPFQMTGGLPTIKELEKTPEKISKKDHIKSRQSIIQTLDIPSETFQTAFTDFEIELIECERSRGRPSDGGEEDFFVSTRPRRVVTFKDDIAESDDRSEKTPEKKSEPSSPETPRAVLRSRMNFLMEQFNELTEDHRSLVEFTQLEKQMFVEEAVEAAMIDHNKIVENLERKLADSEKSRQELFDKYAELQIQFSERDRHLKDLRSELAETRESLTCIKNEKESLVNELQRMKTSSSRTPAQTSNDDNRDKESSSIFANNTYFDEINVSDSHCDSILTNEIESMESLQIYDTSAAIDTSNNKLDDSKKSKDASNATFSEIFRQIEEKSSEELTRVMQDLLNIKVSLEEENAKLGSDLRRKIREADDVKNDIRELKSGIEKLQETIQVLMNENTVLTSKLSSEKEAAREAEKSYKSTLAELNSSINTMAQEKSALEQSMRETDEGTKPTLATDEKTINLINDYKKTIDSLTAENIELSTNLMNKIEELDNLKVLKETSGDHERRYHELWMKLSEDYKLLQAENIELSGTLMEKIEEYDLLKQQYEVSRCKFSSSNPSDERNNLINISLNQTNLTDNGTYSNGDKINGEPKNEKEFQSSVPTVDDLLRLSLPAGNCIVEKGEKTNGRSADDLLRMSIVPGESNAETKNSSSGSVEDWKLKAEMLGEQVENLALLNEKLTNLKVTSCKQCAHLTELRSNRKMLQNEVKSLNRTLEELQTKFDREFADTKILRTKASEDLNLSVCDVSFNNSVNLDGGMNVSYVEERVQSLHSEIESLKEKHEKLTNLYKEKCDEIEKLQDHSFRESTPPTVDSPRLRRDDSKLERIKTDMEKLQNDLRHFKKSIAGISFTLQKFVNEKTTMQNEIEKLKLEKREFAEKFKDNENVSSAEEKCGLLRDEIASLNAEISNYEILERQSRDKISLLEEEVKSLRLEKDDLAEKMTTERRCSSEAREKISSLENEVSRLGAEIANYEAVTEELKGGKTLLEAQIEDLRKEKHVLEEKIISIESTLVPREKVDSLTNEITRMSTEMKNREISEEALANENSSLNAKMRLSQVEREDEKLKMAESIAEKDAKIASLENEIARLSSEVDNSNVVKSQLEGAKSSLEDVIETLKRENKNLEEASSRRENIVEAEEKIASLENEVSRLCSEMENSHRARIELEEAKSSLESMIDSLKNENDVFRKRLADAETSTETKEKIVFFENEVSRLISEIENARTIQGQLEEARSSMKVENDLLSTEKAGRDEMIDELRRSLQKREEENSALRATMEELNSERNRGIADIRRHEESVKSIESKLQRATEDLEERMRINAELNDRLVHLERREEELAVAKAELETKIQSLLSEKASVEENLTSVSESLDRMRDQNSELATITETLESKLADALSDLNARTGENVELKVKVEEYERLGEETTREKFLLTDEITSLRGEIKTLGDSISGLRNTIENLEENNSSLKSQVENSRMSHESRMNAESNESHRTIENYEKIIGELREELRATIKDAKSNFNESEKDRAVERQLEELESAKRSIKQEIMSLKSPADDVGLEEKSAMELFGFFVTTIMSKEQEVIKALSDNFESEKRRIEEKKRQSLDAEKRSAVWAKELEAEIERNQQDMTRLEARNVELSQKIAQLENLLMESNHESEMLKEKMKMLEADFDSSGIVVEKSADALQSSTLNVTRNTTTEKDRFMHESVDTREMELSAKLRLVEKQYKEKLDELTSNLEHQKTRNMDLSNNLDGLEANERQLKNIVDMKTNELARCNATIERIQRELEAMTQSYNRANSENVKSTEKIDEITSLLKSKCDLLSEYKTKLETITPEYEKLKEQANERQLRLEKYKSEIECLTSESEKSVSLLRDRLDSEEIKSSGYRKQLAEMTNRNTTLQMELVELRAKCDELEITNGKLTSSMRNSTSKIRAEEEMEDLRDRNRTLERNLDGAGNRISELQEIKTRLMKDLVDLRVKYETTCAENEELKSVLSSHRSSVADVIESREKYEALLLDKNRLEMELEDRKTRFALLEKRIEASERENKEMRLKNTELDAEMDDIVSRIRDLTKENSELDDKLYSTQTTIDSYEEKVKRLTAINEDLGRKVQGYVAEIEDLKSQRKKLRNDNASHAKTASTLSNEISELRAKMAHHDRGESLSCGDSERSSSPVAESIRIDSRRRRSRNELFNSNRPLEIFGNNEETNNCRCEVLREQYAALEKDLALKNAKIATLELKIQSEVFPHMRKCKDLEEIVASITKKNKLLRGELKKLEESRAQEMSSECQRCRQWKINKRDQASQCMPDSTPIYLSGVSSGIIDVHVKVAKLEKDKASLKTLCRNRQKIIFELEHRVKELEASTGTKSSISDEKSVSADSATSSAGSKPDSASASKQWRAMKENVPAIWGNQRQPFQLRRDWFN